MRELRRVAVGTDFTPGALRAARRATRLPLARNGTIELIHAAPRIGLRSVDAGLERAAARALERQAAFLGRGTAKGIGIRTLMATGPPAETLARNARARRADVLVVGQHGRPGLPDLDLGSTAERLMVLSHVPVLIVRRQARHAYRHALIAVDMAGSASAALALAMRLLAGHGRVTLLHSIELSPESGIRLAGASASVLEDVREALRRQAERFLSGQARRIERAGFTVAQMMTHGDPRSAVLAAARRVRADIVALGTRRTRDRTGLLLGSVARSVARRASVDVLIARGW